MENSILSKPIVRNAILSDSEAIMEVLNHYILESTATFDLKEKSSQEIQDFLAYHDERYVVKVVELNDVVVGWGALTKFSERLGYGEMAEISIYIKHGLLGMGLGKKMLMELLSHAKSSGFHTIVAFITSKNVGSIKLFSSYGFVFNGTMKEVGVKFGKRLGLEIWQVML